MCTWRVRATTPIPSAGYDFATVKYGPDGSQQWVGYYPPLGPKGGVRALAVDAVGNAYVTGWAQSSYVAYVTIKYAAADGHQQWERYYHGPSPYTAGDSGEDIAVDSAGNIYVTGRSGASDGNKDYATIKYGPDGKSRWVARYNGPGNDDDAAAAIAVDSSRQHVRDGHLAGSDGEHDYAIIEYAPGGSQRWVARYDGPGHAVDEARDIAVAGAGNVYVTGHSYDAGSGHDYATIRYTALPDFKQTDLRWADGRLAGQSSCPAVGAGGCALTTVADVLVYYGTPHLTQGYGTINPDNLNRWLAANGGYVRCGIRWEAADNSTSGYVGEPKVLRTGQSDLAARKQAIDDALSQGRPPMLK